MANENRGGKSDPRTKDDEESTRPGAEVVTRPDRTNNEEDSDMSTERAEDSPAKAAEPMAVRTPTTVDGFNVLDADGNTVALCGFGHNRSSSGPVMAMAISAALNRYGKGVR